MNVSVYSIPFDGCATQQKIRTSLYSQLLLFIISKVTREEEEKNGQKANRKFSRVNKFLL